MRTVKRVALGLAALVAALAYVWVAAVRAVPSVRRRKAAARARRRPEHRRETGAPGDQYDRAS